MSDPDDFDAIAGEYVLGSLSPAERAEADTRRAGDAAFDAAILAWEDRLAPLLDLSPAVTPPATVYDAIAARLFGAGPEQAGQVVDFDRLALRRSLRRWQTAFAGAMALAAALAVWIVAAPAPSGDHQFVAVLQKDAGSTAIVLDVDTLTRKLTIRPVSASSPSDKSLELWLIAGNGPPHSLGTVSPTGITRASLSSYDRETIEGATYAVTLEPAGGSPTGKPSSTPILSGHGTSDPR